MKNDDPVSAKPRRGARAVCDRFVLRQLFDVSSCTYTYLLGDRRSRHAVIIDTVFEQYLRDLALSQELGLKLVAALDTHCHADHVSGAWLMRQATGCAIGISKRYGEAVVGANLRLDHGDRVALGDSYLEVRATPGHTVGCLSFVTDDHRMAFTGDCLLIRGAGRCDFQHGDASTLYRSIKQQIFSLPDECLILPAHDYSGRTMSSVGEERVHNSRLGAGADERDFVGFMKNLDLPHPKQIAIAVPANLACGRPPDGKVPKPADWGPVWQNYAGLLEIDPEWVAQHLSEVLVLDVREPEELDERLGWIGGAKSVPLDELRARLVEVAQDKPVICVCHSGTRSAQATVILQSAGFARVANLKGGMLRWQQTGLPVEHSVRSAG